MTRRAGVAAGVGLGAATAVALRRRWRRADRPSMPTTGTGGEVFLDHLARAVRIPTVSYDDQSLVDGDAFDRFHEFLRSTYPRSFEHLDADVVAGHSLLLRWEGSDPEARPVLLHAHMDVVPVETGTGDDWPLPPFGAERDGTFLWGRGTLDDKGDLIAIFEAVEALLVEGFRPDTTVYVTVGHDEEVGGGRGAAALAAVLEERGIRFEFVLDEGGALVEEILPGVRGTMALLGVAEKGYADVEIAATGSGGHASVPPPHTAIGRLAEAVTALEANPMPARLDEQTELFDVMASLIPGIRGLAFRRHRRLGRLVERRLAATPATNAVIRTTAAATVIEGGVKNNVLPQHARAVVNFRIMPGDTVESVVDHVRRVVGDDLEVRLLPAGFTADPATRSSTSSAAYGLVSQTIADTFPGVKVAPWTLMGATDSRHFLSIADDVYRFSPFRLTPEDMGRIHGTGERIRLADAVPAVSFYKRLIRRACGVS